MGISTEERHYCRKYLMYNYKCILFVTVNRFKAVQESGMLTIMCEIEQNDRFPYIFYLKHSLSSPH